MGRKPRRLGRPSGWDADPTLLGERGREGRRKGRKREDGRNAGLWLPFLKSQ